MLNPRDTKHFTQFSFLLRTLFRFVTKQRNKSHPIRFLGFEMAFLHAHFSFEREKNNNNTHIWNFHAKQKQLLRFFTSILALYMNNVAHSMLSVFMCFCNFHQFPFTLRWTDFYHSF